MKGSHVKIEAEDQEIEGNPETTLTCHATGSPTGGRLARRADVTRCPT